jgi:hypothetical protein
LEKYLPTGDTQNDANLLGMGGVFNGLNLGLYTYSHQNPIKLLDPDGNAVFENAQKLTEAGNTVLADPSVQPGANGGATWCNRGVGLIEAAGGNTTSYGNGQPNQYLRANEMVTKLQDPKFATSVTPKQAVDYAKQGATVVAGWKNPSGESGHVAIVAPKDMGFSGSLGKKVPYVFNVGSTATMGVGLTSATFGISDDKQPNFYIRNEDLNTLRQRDFNGLIGDFPTLQDDLG